MGVTVQHHIRPRRRHQRRNVDEPKHKTFAFQIQHPRPVLLEITVSPHDMQRPVQSAEHIQIALVRHVAQVPDLIRVRDLARHMKRQMVVSIGKYSDAHPSI